MEGNGKMICNNCNEKMIYVKLDYKKREQYQCINKKCENYLVDYIVRSD